MVSWGFVALSETPAVCVCACVCVFVCVCVNCFPVTTDQMLLVTPASCRSESTSSVAEL